MTEVKKPCHSECKQALGFSEFASFFYMLWLFVSPFTIWNTRIIACALAICLRCIKPKPKPNPELEPSEQERQQSFSNNMLLQQRKQLDLAACFGLSSYQWTMVVVHFDWNETGSSERREKSTLKLYRMKLDSFVLCLSFISCAKNRYITPIVTTYVTQQTLAT